ncbi:MAG: hypothetical protein ACOYJJ_07710 [Anaerovoracaceae bacterium]|jgi:hypothetical protein
MKKKTLIAAAVLLAAMTALLLTGCSLFEHHLYDKASIRSTTSESGEKLSYSYVEVSKDDVTKEALTDYYFTYFENHDLDFGIIRYSGSDKGVYIGDYGKNDGTMYVDKGVTLTSDSEVDESAGYDLRYKPDEDNDTLKLVRKNQTSVTGGSSDTQSDSDSSESDSKDSKSKSDTSTDSSSKTEQSSGPDKSQVVSDAQKAMKSYFSEAKMSDSAGDYTIRVSGTTVRVDGRVATDGTNYQYFTLKLKYKDTSYSSYDITFLQIGSTVFTD